MLSSWNKVVIIIIIIIIIIIGGGYIKVPHVDIEIEL